MKRHSIGKRFRKLKGLRKADPNAVIPETPKQLQDYIETLTAQGVYINKVKYAIFQTKNGLKYPGLIASEKILSNETLVSVPKDLLLTTRHAFESPLKQMFLDHPQYFSNQFYPSWEDHQLMAFILYEYQRGPESEWHLLISNLPRDIDYLVFWSHEEQDLLDDEPLVKLARKQYQEFLIEFETLKCITDKYPQLFKPETVTLENARWVYTHLVTRCFGKYLAYVTMVPFCELFNHECTDVFYDFEYNADNPHKSEESEQAQVKELKEDEELSVTSSEGSYHSEDEISDSEYVIETYEQYKEFDFDEFSEQSTKKFYEEFSKILDIKQQQNEEQEQINQVLDNQQDEELQNKKMKDLQEQQIKMKKDFNIKLNLQREVFLLSRDCKTFIFQNIDYGDNYSIFFIGQMFSKLDKSIQEYINGGKAYFMAREEVKRIQLTSNTYKNNLYAFQKDIMKKPIYQNNYFQQKRSKSQNSTLDNAEQILSQPLDPECEYYKPVWEKDKFDRFVMKAASKDQFEKGAQVYFCYGRLSNRMMLMRYGMSLEYNKYDHAHLRIEYLKYIQSNEAIWLVHKYQLSKYKRFKLKHSTFPIDLIVFCKSIYWTFNVHSLDTFFKIQDLKLERRALQLALEILIEEIQKFQDKLEDNEKLLYDNTLGYHEYFAVIYRLERQRIYHHNINLIKICIVVIDRMLDGVPFEQATEKTQFDYEYCETNRIILKKYFEQMRYALYLPK
ncbi:unnamed protein product [Paramecium pentaurelia]|uniref:Rubisco LSMT substrate-binding domain-containing protein n=1 Tax=Paramecium pentaurelia TaxID=43138 RepID=A0A8S1V1K2_9CILI|nr:unnamed protein product [Paramecium pentaurelia]